MNVIFLDFDGVIDTYKGNSDEYMESKIKLLSSICKEFDCKVVISSSRKEVIDEKTIEVKEDIKWIKNILNWMKKYGIECIGITPTIGKQVSEYHYMPIWKEYEIITYIKNHPEIKHFCVLDDDDLQPRNSDLNLVRDHLVTTLMYADNIEEQGLLESHRKLIGKILEKDIDYEKLYFLDDKTISH